MLARFAAREARGFYIALSTQPGDTVGKGISLMAEAVKSGGLRTTALLISGAGTIFWLYTFYGIAQVPSGDGSGMQWIAIMPLGLVFLVLTLPALIFALSGFLLRFAIGLGIASLVAFALLWNELLKEFYH